MRFAMSLSLGLLIAIQAAAQKPLAVENLGKVNAFGTVLKFSPDGRFVAYEVKDWSLTTETYGEFSPIGTPPIGIGGNVWIIDTKSGQARNLTLSQGSNWGPSWSPDGKYLAFYSDRNHKPQLWLWDMAKGSSRLVTEAMVRPYQAMDTVRWTADSKKVLLKLVPEEMSIEELDKLNNPEAERNQKIIEKTGGPSMVVFSSRDPGDTARSQAKKNAGPDIAPYLSDLALVDVASGKVERIGRRVMTTWYEFSPKGGQISFAEATRGPEGFAMPFTYRVSVYSMTDRKTRILAREIHSVSSVLHSITWSPDGETLAYTDGPDRMTGNCYIVNVASGQQRPATEASHPSFLGDGLRGPLWTPDGRSLYFLGGNAVWAIEVATGAAREVGKIPGKILKDLMTTANDTQVWMPEGGASVVVLTLDTSTQDSGFYRIETATGASHKLIEQARLFREQPKLFANVSADGQRLVYVAQDTAHPDDAWITASDFHDPQRLTNINPQLNNIPMGAARLVEWKTAGGATLHGALLLPSDYHEGQRCPLLLDVNGGALPSNRLNRYGLGGNFWTFNKQIFATRGYAVLMPDMPLKVGSPMREIADDVLPAVNKLVAMGIADPDRIGVMGIGYGGYSVLALLVQTKFFKAAFLHAGEGDLFNVYGALSEDGEARSVYMAEKGQLMMGGTPWEYRDRYVENSPFFYLDRIETPLLMTHGTSDVIVPVYLGDQIFVGLRRLGKDVTYVKYKGEGYLFQHYADSVDWLNRIIAWFDDHLKAPGGTQLSTKGDARPVR